jgi:predicted membrane-bound spermidine synthase
VTAAPGPVAARPVGAAALLAFAGLTAELAWTRVAGLLFFGEAAWLMVTLAVAGGAAGAAAGAARPAWLRPAVTAGAALAAAGAIVAGLAIVLAADGRGGVATAAAAALPGFALLGLALAGLFAGDPRHAPRLYAADLIGAALAAAASLPLVAWLGAPDALLVAAVAALLAGAARAPRASLRRVAAGLIVATGLALALPGVDADPRRAATAKPLTFELGRGGERLASRWGSVGRSDLIRRADGAEVLYLDGSAGSLLPTADAARLWRSDMGRFAFEALRPERVFVVGGGAGLEVAHALETGAVRIDVAELNGAGADLARERLAELASGAERAVPDPFEDPRVAWYRDEARATLRALARPYDLITLSQAVTRTAEARGLALSENGLYTVEATRDLLSALAPGGAVAYELYDEATLTRSLATAGTALVESGRAAGVADSLQHLVAFLDPRTSPPTPLLLVFGEPLARTEVVALARAAEARGYGLLLLPELLTPPSLQPLADGTADWQAPLAGPGVDLSPTRDDAPFYWAFDPGVPPALRRALLGWAALAAPLAAVLVLARRRRAPTGPPGRRRGLAAALALGTVFLATELAVLSRAGLLLGHPAASLAVTLAGLLAGAGAGAAWARRRPDRWSALATAALAAALAAAAWTLAWPFVAEGLASRPAWLRAAATLATLLPLGAALGAPFPLLLRRLGHDAGRDAPSSTVARAWALNGLGSLAGGLGAIAAAHLVGFAAVAWLAAAGYLAVAGLSASVPAGDAA